MMAVLGACAVLPGGASSRTFRNIPEQVLASTVYVYVMKFAFCESDLRIFFLVIPCVAPRSG